MTAANKCLMVGLLAVLSAAPGCSRSLSGLSSSDWGPSAEGLQCRLAVERQTWRADETLSFSFDLRNRGRRTFAFWPRQKVELAEIEFDGKWYRWPRDVKTEGQVWKLGPGSQYYAVTIELDRQFGIDIRPGRHTVRLAYVLEGVRVVSNPVAIRIVAAD
ncbi:MAG: hypothetical protein JW720_16195 [Sedimentisphaerales bacterium]|nr:hypothetical protein [Sedimentisphaerales bacterium]